MEETLGKRIVTNRKRMGLTQDQLAERLGVTVQAVSKWENDQSCPDITMLPKLAEIFGTSTDVLLGVVSDSAAPEAEAVVTEPPAEGGFEVRNGNWEFKYDNSRRTNLMIAVTVLLIGGLYLLSGFMSWNADLWGIAWPSFLLVFGLFGLYPKFSFFRLGVALTGGYFLADNLFTLPFGLDSGTVIAVALLLFGGALLMDTLRKPRKPKFEFSYNSDSSSGIPTQDFRIEDDYLCFNASFGEQYQVVEMDRLAKADISTSFGDFTLDLSDVSSIAPGCTIEANASFGELTLRVPSRYQVRSTNSVAFASVETEGRHDPNPVGIIQLNANASFGQITVEYI